jgi:hypothetical protein
LSNQILIDINLGRKRFALKKVQPWNSVKVTFDIPKEAADRLRLLAIEGNICLIDLGIISIDIPGQSNTIVINKPSTMNSSQELPTSSSLHSSYLHDNTNENDSWSGYKMKINGVHYYPPQQIQPNISSSRLNSTSIENS